MSSNYDEDNAEALRKILPLIPEEVEYSSDRTAKYNVVTDKNVSCRTFVAQNFVPAQNFVLRAQIIAFRCKWHHERDRNNPTSPGGWAKDIAKRWSIT